MNFKKKVNGSWTDTPHYIHNTSTDTLTTLPTVIYPTGTTVTVGLKGNAVQSSTPSPTSPVMPNGTGERTGNLADRTMCAENMLLTWSNGTLFPENGSIVTDFIRVNSGDELVTNYNCQKMFYDKNKVFLGALLNDGTLAVNTSTNVNTGMEFTVPNVADIAYVQLGYRVTYNAADMLTANIMLNTGSTPLPYEPYGYKIPISSGGVNLLPEFYVSSGEISGNSYAITKNSIETHNDGSVLGSYFVLTEFKRGSNYANYIPIDEKHSFKIPAGTYTSSANENTHNLYNGLCLIVGQLGKTVSGATSGAEHIRVGRTFTINEDSYVCPILEIRSDSLVDEYILTNPMLNRGSTALPYEPYVQPTLSNIYLGEVESTRRIKKIVFDGTESWTITAGKFYYTLLPSYPINWLAAITSHFEVREDISSTGCARFGGTETIPQNTFIFNYDNGAGGIAAWKEYLAQQYANGTPVTIWYVLAEPTTGIVNEPLMKIGDYADEVSGITIPVTAGGDTLSVDTTVQPSEVSLNYKGWHPVSAVHERESGQWT